MNLPAKLVKTAFELCVLAGLLGARLFAQTPDAFNPNANDVVYSLAVQPDGKVCLGGFFTYVGGQPHNHLARVNSEGSVDATFVPAADGFVGALVVQPDGAIVVGGNFGVLGGQPRNRLGRVSADGAVDPAFNPGADGVVECLALQPDGKILVGGFFGHVGGQPRNCLGRLNPDGTLDASFNPGASYGVTSLIVQPDGKILVGGWFGTLAGTNRAYLGRLNPDGSVDAAFNPGADNLVNCLALQPDGKVLAGGWFTNLAGQPRSFIGRLNADGSPDAGFNPGANDQVYSLAVQTDGAILAGGYFTNLGGQTCNYLGRVSTNGVVDAAFNPNSGGQVSALAIQPDGKVLVGGWFNSLGGSNRSAVARLNNTAAATQSLSFKTSKITWLRGGPGPEVGRVTFDGSTDGGSTWANLGAPVRTTGGWQLTGVSIAGSASIRARGLVASGQYEGSSWLVETNIGPLAIVQQPASRTNTPGMPAFFTVRVGGGSTPAYQWRKNGVNLSNSTNISGANSATLVLSNAFGSDTGAYTVVITDSQTTLTSQAAVLTVLDPYITTQPVSLTNTPKSTATFSAAAIGQPPLSYWWFKDGAPLNDSVNVSGSHSPTLTLSNVLGADAGGYWVVISDASGSVTSSVATLTVIDPWFSLQPVDQAKDAGQSATFTATALGTTPLALQWLQNGTNLNDNGNIGGSQTATLTIANVAGANAGTYQVIASNSWGTAASSVAGLSVVDPFIYTNPASQAVQGGQAVALNIVAAGTQPLSYQWRKAGAPLPGATGSTLLFTGVQGSDAGSYDVVVSDSFGTLTSAVVTLTVADPYITANPTNQYLQSGQTVFLSVTAGGGSPLAYQWLRNGVPVPAATNASLIVTNAQGTNAGYFSVVVSDAFASLTSLVAAVTINAVVANGLAIPVARVVAAALQPDGKILLGMDYSSQAPGASAGFPNPLRLNPDGSVDPSFGSRVTNSSVNCLAVQNDGKILVGGASSSATVRLSYLRRFNADGSVDAGFTNHLGAGPSGPVYCLALQSDGKAVLGGSFSLVNGQAHANLARLNSDGSLDTNFNASANSVVYSLALQPDGAILAGGGFTALDGQSRNYVGRFNSDGSLDTNFTARAGNAVYCVVVQADARILVAGWFTSLDGQTFNHIGRLNSDGTADPGFNPNANGLVESLAVQTDGAVLLGGTFTSVGGLTRNRLARVNANGLVDLAFNPGVLGTFDIGAYSLALQSDGAILAGGQFTNIAGQVRTNFSRLINTAPATQSLNFDAASVTWLRDGSGPEAWRVTFETSTDGLVWSNLGTGERITGGWQFSGTSPGAPRNVRARGFVTGGEFAGSSWFAETISGPPALDLAPVSRTNIAGTTATFLAEAGGGQPLTYQWLKDGTPVSNAGNVSGANTPTLILSNVFGADAGAYSLLITNANGAITSSIARLSVIEPIITSQPTNQFANTGQSVSFSVAALGTAPLIYQWRKDGTNLAGPNAPTLVLTNVTRAGDAGSYSVAVASSYGAITSSIVTLMVDPALPDSLNAVANGAVKAVATQADGKILLGGDFTNLAGAARAYIGRLNADGTLDTNFNPGANYSVQCFAVQADGKIVVGGWFGGLGGQPRNYLGRLQADGSLDLSFTNAADGPVNCLALQPDGKILVGGWFSTLGGRSQPHLGRLDSDGSVDTNFLGSANGRVNTIALQPDGRILASGEFSALDLQPANRIGRLAADGSFDSNFLSGANDYVSAMALQPDGKIIVAGNFTTLRNQPRSFVGRLNPDGTLDTGFNPAVSGTTEALALQADGKIIIAGIVSPIIGQTLTFMARLNPDGSLDTTFAPTPNSAVLSLAVEADGTTLIGGDFTSVSGQPRTRFARLTTTDAAAQYLSSDGLSITWLRGGTAPEIGLATFETSTDGTNWTSAGVGTRIPQGWRSSGLSLPAGASIRARGSAVGGYYTGSGWFVESLAHVLAPAPIIDESRLGFSSNQLSFVTLAVPGQAFAIEASVDLANWTALETNVVMIPGDLRIPPANVVPFSFADSQASFIPHRYYRARLVVGGLP